MGRSRAASHLADEDPNQRSKKRRATSNVETLSPGLGINEGKAALYHCNYCHKDISSKIRIKCVLCQDFDLCIECFSVGAEVTPHKSNHPYRVMDNLSFPLICPDWNTDEEILLLEGIEMYGFGNWSEVAEHVGTKSKSQCIDHYNTIYMNSPCFPLPDMSHVVGKSREELLAMAKEHNEVIKEFPQSSELTMKEEPLLSEELNFKDYQNEEPTLQISSSSAAVLDMIPDGGKTHSSSYKKASNITQIKDEIKVEESQSGRSIGEKKPKVSGEDGPSMIDLYGYNSKRHEFDIEYDNDAEQVLADMEFKDTDTDAERSMKLQVLHIYSKRLDERKRRKDFVLERGLLYPDPFEKSLSPEEQEICKCFQVFMRFHSKEEHEEWLKSMIEEYRITKRIQDLQEARAAGCRTAAEANRFIELKRKNEAEHSANKESSQAGLSCKSSQRPMSLKGELDANSQGGVKGITSLYPGSRDSAAKLEAITKSLEDWNVTGLPGADLLTEPEKRLCSEIRILPSHYLNMLQIISVEISKGTITKKSDAHSLFKIDPSKLDKVYDILVNKGIAEV